MPWLGLLKVDLMNIQLTCVPMWSCQFKSFPQHIVLKSFESRCQQSWDRFSIYGHTEMCAGIKTLLSRPDHLVKSLCMIGAKLNCELKVWYFNATMRQLEFEVWKFKFDMAGRNFTLNTELRITTIAGGPLGLDYVEAMIIALFVILRAAWHKIS